MTEIKHPLKLFYVDVATTTERNRLFSDQSFLG